MLPQETDPDLPMSVQERLVGAWVDSGLLRGRGTECSSASWDLWKEVAITSTIVWSQVKQQGGNTAPPINRRLD